LPVFIFYQVSTAIGAFDLVFTVFYVAIFTNHFEPPGKLIKSIYLVRIMSIILYNLFPGNSRKNTQKQGPAGKNKIASSAGLLKV
jgi:hypothetical protein